MLFPKSISKYFLIAICLAILMHGSQLLGQLPGVKELPEGLKNGINYIDENTVTLVLHDPAGIKNSVHVIGDFNDWEVNEAGLMNEALDGKHFWLTIGGLTPGVEYAFQYLIDQQLRIADPNSEKILDPDHDAELPASAYPDLKPYPHENTTGIVSVMQTGQTPYEWQVEDFVSPLISESITKLVMYELLIRDFVESRGILEVASKLDYLQNLGVSAIKLLPVSEFEGNEGMGFQTTFYFAMDKAYGTKNDLKTFIDECHNRNIAVIMDFMFDHASPLSPLVQMYWDPEAQENGQPSEYNPWFNQQPTHPNSQGPDFNHESQYTRQFVKDVITHWMEEYKLDGVSFSSSKGFTQTFSGDDIGMWNTYDQSRVNILIDYYEHTKSIKPEAILVLDHYANNDEEVVLSNHGFLIMGDFNAQFGQNTMGFESNHDFSWAFYTNRGYTFPHLIPFIESHKHERLMHLNLTYGNTGTTTLEAALKRMEAAAILYIALPGPKMVWQFGELGYDYSLFHCPDSTFSPLCSTSPKPVRWDYLDNKDRQRLFWTYASMIKFRAELEPYFYNHFSQDLSGMGKRMWISGPTTKMAISTNFATVPFNMNPGFPNSGTWYNFFTGESFEVTDPGGHTIYYNPGDYYVFVNTPVAPAYVNLNFEVKNAELNLVEDALVDLHGFYGIKTDAAGVAEFIVPSNTTIGYTVSKPGLPIVSGTVEIASADVSLVIVLQEEVVGPDTYSIQFNVTDINMEPIDDAVITFDENTNIAGAYTFDEVEAGTYAYTVSRDGYLTIEVPEFEVTQDQIIEITMLVDNTSTAAHALKEIKLFPNPAGNLVFIDSPVEIKRLEIADITGKVLFSSENVQNEIRVSGLISGIYFVRLFSQEFVSVKKLWVVN